MLTIVDFLNKMKLVVETSFQIEFAGRTNERGANPQLFAGVDSPIVLKRASLFLELKDAYEMLSHPEKSTINALVCLFSQTKVPKIFSNVNDFIDFIVGGDDGNGACLQSATNTIFNFHIFAVNALEYNDECPKINDNFDDYKKMPPFTISEESSTSEQNIDQLSSIVNWF